MVRLGNGQVTGDTIDPHVVNKLTAARKRPRTSLEYKAPPGSRDDLVLPPKAATPPQRSMPTQHSSPSRRGTGIPPPQVNTIPEERSEKARAKRQKKGPRRNVNNRQTRGTVQDKMLDDLKQNGVPVFQWVVLLVLLLLGAHQLRKTLSLPSSKDTSSRGKWKRSANSKSLSSSKSKSKASQEAEIQALLEQVSENNEQATAKKQGNSRKAAKNRTKQRKSPNTPTKPATKAEETPRIARKKSSVIKSNGALSANPELILKPLVAGLRKSTAKNKTIAVNSQTSDAKMAQELLDEEMKAAAKENPAIAHPENEWAEVPSKRNRIKKRDN